MTRNYSTNSNSFSLENKGKNKKKKTTVDRSKYTIEYPLNEIIIGLLLGDGHIQKRKNSEYSEESRQVRLEEAYDQRADVINELGYKESDLTLAIEEAERAEEEAKTLGPAGAMWN